MSKFNTKKATTRTTNLAGGVAFSMNAEQELLHAVLTTFLENKFYESGDERLERIKSLCAQVSPRYLAQLALVARTEFNLRTVPVVLLGELSTKSFDKNDVKDYGSYKLGLLPRAITAVISRPDELMELVSYLKANDYGLSKQVKRGLRHAILKFNGYKLAKYRGENKEFKLVDIFNLVHPNAEFATEEQKKAWGKLIADELTTKGQTWESVISASKDQKGDWEALLRENKLGYMALLRNLNNMVKNDISDEVVDIVCKKLIDPEEVKKSKQLPFRFVTAYDNLKGNRKFKTAISMAMDVAVGNAPELPGKTLIAIDCSGSMNGGAIQKAAIFGATLAKANINADVILYDDKVKEILVSVRMPVIDIAKDIEQKATGGGTNTSLVFEYAIKKTGVYDRFIIISDNESWQDSARFGYWGYNGYGTQEAYNKYKTKTGTSPWVYAIDVQGYGTKDISDNRVIHLAGWSERLLDFINKYEEGTDLVNYIKSVEL